MRFLLKVIAVLSGGLSLFRLGTHLWWFDLSTVIQQIVDVYQKMLTPIVIMLGPLFYWVADYFSFDLPIWWPHLLVVWIVLGGIGGRAWVSVETFGEPDPSESIIGLVAGLTLGPIYLLIACIGALRDMFEADFEYAGYILREVFYVALSAIVFFATNTFTL